MKTLINKKQYLEYIFSLIVALFFGLYSVKLGQDQNWDVQNYHLYNAYAYLNDRINFDLAPAGLQTYFNPYLDIAYFIAVANFSPKTVGFILGFIQGLNFFIVYKISSHVLKEYRYCAIYSFLLAFGGVLSAGFLSEVGTIFNDNLVSIFPLLALWMIISTFDFFNFDRHRTFALVICSGALVGIGCGLKLVTLIYALSMCLSFLVMPFQWHNRIKLTVLFGLAVLAGLLMADGYWLYKMWNLYGNPLFPQFNHFFHGEMAEYSPIRDWRFLPKSFFEMIFYPVLFTLNPSRVSEFNYEQVSWLFAYVAILALLANRVINLFKEKPFKRFLNIEAGFLIAFFCISYFLWLIIFGIYRYLITIEILIPLILFVAINHFFESKLSAQWSAILFIGAITTVNMHNIPNWGHSSWAQHVYHVIPNNLSGTPEPAIIFLGGQPLAWIIPALDIKTPFLQAVPNMPVSEAYWKRAKSMIESREGKSFIILKPGALVYEDQSKTGLAQLGLSMNDKRCGRLVAYLGSTESEFKYCEVN